MGAYADAVAALTGVRGHWDMATGLPNLVGSLGALTAGASPGTLGGSPNLHPTDASVHAAVGKATTSSEIGSLATSTSLDITSSVTIGCWFNLANLSGTIGLVNRTNSYYLTVLRSKVSFNTGAHTALTSADNLVGPLSTYFVVGTWDGTTQKLYLNGALVASNAASGSVSAQTTALRIGSQDFGAAIVNGMTGTFAAPFFATGVATLAQVQNLYQLGAKTVNEAFGFSMQVYPWTRVICNANSARNKVTIVNDSDSIVYMALGSTAFKNGGIRLQPNGGSYTTSTYTGDIAAISGATQFNTGPKNVTIAEET